MLFNPFVEQQIYKGRTHFEKVAIFVQKGNDIDTCASALALAKVFKKKGAKSVIYGLKIKYSAVSGIKDFNDNKNNQMVVDEDTLAVLVDVNAYRQILEPHWRLIRKCGAIIRIDHHEETEDFKDEMLEITDKFASSTAEIIWQLVKNEIKNHPIEFKKDVAETCFFGIYGDTKGLTSSVNQKTFTTLAEICEYTDELPKLMKCYDQKCIRSNKVIAEIIQELVVRGKTIIANLRPEIMYRYYPENFKTNERGIINQRTLFTMPLNYLEKNVTADYIVYIHFCLIKPFNNDKKFIFIVLNKKNKELEKVLKKYEFFKHRNRFSNPDMTLPKLIKFLEDNKELFEM